MKTKKILLTLMVVILSIATVAKADFTKVLNYQGRLTDANGIPVADGPQNMTFEICTDAACASVVYTEAHVGGNAVTVEDGMFSTTLGVITALTLDFDSAAYYVQVSIGATTFTPTQRIAAAAMAINVSDSAVNSAKVEDNTLTAADLLVNVVSTLSDGTTTVTNDGGNIAIVGSGGITVTGNDVTKTITISPAGGGGIDHGSLSGLADDDHSYYVDKVGDTMTGVLLMSGAAADLTFNNAGGIITIAGGTIVDSAGDVTVNDDLGVTGTIIGSSTVQGTQLISTVGIGTSPLTVTSSTKVTNLNADLLDDLNTGNGSGNIPVSNGTVNTNLNADLLDGYHAADIDTISDHGSLLGLADDDHAYYVDKIGDTITGALLMSGAAADLTFNNAGGNITTAGGTIIDSAGDVTVSDDLGVTGTITGSSTVQGTQIISTIGLGTAPLTVTSSTKVTNLNADLLDGYNTGNASTNIPLNNTTLNTDLNADLLDGYHASGIGAVLDHGTLQGLADDDHSYYVDKIGDTMTGALLMSGAAADITFNNAGGNITTAGGVIIDSAGDVTVNDALGVTGAITGSSTVQGTQFISTVGLGTAPMTVTSTTKVTNLNVDLLDDLNTGNGSGNIPISNGTVNTNLNADLLDGYHAADIDTISDHGSLLGLTDDDHTYYVDKIGDTMTGTLTINAGAGTGLTVTRNVASANVANFTGGADDISYEWVGFYSGATRYGIFIWDKNWSTQCPVDNTFCMASDANNMTIGPGGGTLYVNGILEMRNKGITNIDWASSDDGSGSGLDSDLLDGLHASDIDTVSDHGTLLGLTDDDHTYYVDKVGDTMTGVLTMNNSSYIVGPVSVRAAAGDNYNKFNLWGGTTYGIGMYSGHTYGSARSGLNGYAMTFTMDTTANRGFLWRDSSDLTSDGAMSLSTSGVLVVKGMVNAEAGVSVDGSVVIDGNTGADLWHRSYNSGGWYNGTYGGGIHMQDTTWVRTYGSKSFYVNNTIRGVRYEDNTGTAIGYTVAVGNGGNKAYNCAANYRAVELIGTGASYHCNTQPNANGGANYTVTLLRGDNTHGIAADNCFSGSLVCVRVW